MRDPRGNPIGRRPKTGRRKGAVLIVVLWVLMILGLLVSAMAFEMHIEANITSYYRKRFKSQQLAQAGIEWAKMILLKASQFSQDEDMEEGHPELYLGSVHLDKGLAIRGLRHALGDQESRRVAAVQARRIGERLKHHIGVEQTRLGRPRHTLAGHRWQVALRRVLQYSLGPGFDIGGRGLA